MNVTNPNAPSGANGPSRVIGTGGISTSQWLNYRRQHPIRKVDFRNPNLDDCTKLVILNTNGTEVADMWTELRKILDDKSYESIIKVKRVQYRSNRPSFTVWVRGDMAQKLVRSIRDMTKERTPALVQAIKAAGLAGPLSSPRNVHSWRVAIWREWRDRVDLPKQGSGWPRGLSEAIGSWNVNGFHSKKLEIAEAMKLQKIGIMALQETLASASNYPVVVAGYITYAVPRQEGFRGQALLVDDRWSSYVIPHGEELSKFVIHVKVSGVQSFGGPIHVFSVYLPSGGNFRKARRKVVAELRKLSADIMRLEPQTPIIILGDFNYDAAELDKQLSKGSSFVYRFVPAGSGFTRFPKVGKMVALDHLVVNQPMGRILRKPRVQRQFAISDHRLIVSRIRRVTDLSKKAMGPKPAPRFSFDSKMIYRNSEGIVHHNKWSVLDSIEIDTPVKLSEAGEKFSQVFEEVVVEHDVKKTIKESEKRYLPRWLAGLNQRYQDLSKQVANKLSKGQNANKEKKLMGKALTRFKTKREGWERKIGFKKIANLAEDFTTNDQGSVWRDLQSRVNRKKGQSAFNPVRDKGGVLQLSEDGIVEATREHYRVLAQDDPDFLSRKPDYWDKIDLGEERPELEGINSPLLWTETLLAIRGMNRNTAPGKDGVHVNVLKILLREECLMELKRLNQEFQRLDNVWVDLPKEKLPTTPLTPMGKSLFKILEAVWDMERTPEIWDEVYVANLFKGGDPELLVNYRGISLISCAMKIILCVMVERLSLAIEKANLIVPEQAGFRKREEAVAQFTAIAEIVRRRRISKQDTFGVFIDFKKAYDKVHHHALYRICSHMGIRGKSLDLIKYIYGNSDMTIRTGGYYAEPFRMLRGVRQGCPLSPLLFILFINSALEESTAGGVSVPGTGDEGPRGNILVYDDPLNCKGGMYADDLVILEDSAWKAKLACRRIDKWCRKWGMEIGTGKCGVQCWSDLEVTVKDHNETKYWTPAGEIPKVETYKYLGIVVDKTFGTSRGTLGTLSWEYKHSKVLATRGHAVLSIFKPLLKDRLIPIPLKVATIRTFIIPKMIYGSEVIGFKQLHADPMQAVVNIAVRWVLGRAGSDKSVCITTAMYELGIPSIEETMAGLRARLHYKLETKLEGGLKSWIQTLFDHPFSHRQQTWVTANQKWIRETTKGTPRELVGGVRRNAPRVYEYERTGLRKYSENAEMENHPLRLWAFKGRIAEKHTRSNPYESSWIGYRESLYRKYTRIGEYVGEAGEVLDNIGLGDEFLPDTEARQLAVSVGMSTPEGFSVKLRSREIMDCVLERLLEGTKTLSFARYDRFSLGASRDYLRWSINRPDLTEGIRWLCAIRCNSFPRVRESRRERGTGPGTRIVFGDPDICPLCNGVLRSGWEWAHLLTRCSHAKAVASRTKLDSEVRPWYGREFFKPRDNGPAWGEEMAAIPEMLAAKRSGDKQCFQDMEELYALHLVGGVVNDAFYNDLFLGYGHLLALPEGIRAHLYVYVAEFLQEVAPLYCLKVRWTAYGEISDSSSLGGSNTGANE